MHFLHSQAIEDLFFVRERNVFLMDFYREDFFDFQNWFRKPGTPCWGKGGSVESLPRPSSTGTQFQRWDPKLRNGTLN
jgi:hypothetical protein